VSFKYPTRQELTVLKQFSCKFEAGKTTALVGPSGSGKSTIIQMLERFYNPTSGSITLDGRKIDELEIHDYRHHIGYIGQEPVLFNTSIEKNLQFSKPDATIEEMEKALKDASALKFVMDYKGATLKEKLQTQVGGGGS
jgi:ABC-type multidrug transport system fused ATPase/permease subunit